ncbi:nascent polypeptide-associated complex subunit beta-like protein [Tanacetum coccineum]
MGKREHIALVQFRLEWAESLLNTAFISISLGKKKAVHKPNTTDDKRLLSTLKRIGVQPITQIEEVNIFKDETVIQFLNPKVQAAVSANTWVVSGSPQTKKLQDILPSILNQLGMCGNLGPDSLRKLAEQFKQQGVGEGEDATPMTTIQEDDDEVPELVAGETFEAAAEEGQKSRNGGMISVSSRLLPRGGDWSPLLMPASQPAPIPPPIVTTTIIVNHCHRSHHLHPPLSLPTITILHEKKHRQQKMQHYLTFTRQTSPMQFVAQYHCIGSVGETFWLRNFWNSIIPSSMPQ